jgi:PAS domain S-box-containing protein
VNIAHRTHTPFQASCPSRQRAELLATVFANLGQRLNPVRTPEEAASIVMDVADELLGWDAFTLDLYSPEKDRIYHVHNCDTIDGQRRTVPPVYHDAPPSPLARQVIEAGGQLILRTTPQADSGGIPFGDTARPSASLLFVPIRDGARVVGILSIQSYTPNAYGSKDLELIQSLADHCSGALDRIQATETMRESEARFRQLAENINEVFWITDPAKNQILYVSPAYEAIWGRFCASVLESPHGWLEAIHPEDRDRVLEAALTKQLRGEYEETYRIIRPDASVRWVHDRAFPIRDAAGQVYRIVGVAADITNQRNLEQQLRHIQKMESIGQLAAGVAHDFNNVLAVIRGNAELALMDAGDSTGELADFLQQITAASDRAAHLTRQLLMFARKQVVQLHVIVLNEVVGNMTKMLKRILGEDITLQVSYGSNLSVVLADVGMMEQVIMNLAVNARDAMPEGGRLILSTSDVQIDEGYVQLNPQSTTGGYVCVSVSDTGWGIDREVQARIFDPFFTTKGVGKGTGLGLATVYGIVQQHKGWITVYSEAGHGATFRLYLPVAGTVAEDEAQRVAEPQVAGGKETILLVEDDAAVRALMRNVLERYGYTVIEAESGVKALKVWETQGDQIALLLTDMVMPDGITGRALAQKLHSLKPTLPVIYTSGYSADVVAKGFKLKEGTNFLQKPCAPRMLALAVRQSLDRLAAQSDTISEAES